MVVRGLGMARRGVAGTVSGVEATIARNDAQKGRTPRARQNQ